MATIRSARSFIHPFPHKYQGWLILEILHRTQTEVRSFCPGEQCPLLVLMALPQLAVPVDVALFPCGKKHAAWTKPGSSIGTRCSKYYSPR